MFDIDLYHIFIGDLLRDQLTPLSLTYNQHFLQLVH